MKLQSQREYDVTREKLADLQKWYEEAQNRPNENAHVKELTLQSLGRLIKQLKEEMMWYECHSRVREESGPAANTLTNAGGTSSPCTN